MARTRRMRSIPLALSIPVVFLGVMGWLTYARVQRIHRDALLIEAVKNEDTARAIALLEQGADPNAQDVAADTRSVWQILLDGFRGSRPKTAGGATALIVAITWHDKNDDFVYPQESIPLIKALLDRGADVQARDHEGFTPLILAALSGERDTVNLLIDRGADVNAKIDRGAVVNTKVDRAGWSALIWAAYYGEKDMVQILLDRGANINQPDDGGRTALTWAINQRRGSNHRLNQERMETIQALLDRCPDLRVRDSRGWTALTWARWRCDPEVMRLVQRAYSKAGIAGEAGRSSRHGR